MKGRIATRQLSSGLPCLSAMACGGKWSFVSWKLCMARPICFRLFVDCARIAAILDDWTAGSIMATASGTTVVGFRVGNDSREMNWNPRSSTVQAKDDANRNGRRSSGAGIRSGSISSSEPSRAGDASGTDEPAAEGHHDVRPAPRADHLDQARQVGEHLGQERLARVAHGEERHVRGEPVGRPGQPILGGRAASGLQLDRPARDVGGGAHHDRFLPHEDRRAHPRRQEQDRRGDREDIAATRPFEAFELGARGLRVLPEGAVGPLHEVVEDLPERLRIVDLDGERGLGDVEHPPREADDRVGGGVDPGRDDVGDDPGPEMRQDVLAQPAAGLLAHDLLGRVEEGLPVGVEGPGLLDELAVEPRGVDRGDGVAGEPRRQRGRSFAPKVGWSKRARAPVRGEGASTRVMVINASSWKPQR